jgi:hypothetical protein
MKIKMRLFAAHAVGGIALVAAPASAQQAAAGDEPDWKKSS